MNNITYSNIVEKTAFAEIEYIKNCIHLVNYLCKSVNNNIEFGEEWNVRA